jgi:hypothetical protein
VQAVALTGDVWLPVKLMSFAKPPGYSIVEALVMARHPISSNGTRKPMPMWRQSVSGVTQRA